MIIIYGQLCFYISYTCGDVNVFIFLCCFFLVIFFVIQSDLESVYRNYDDHFKHILMLNKRGKLSVIYIKKWRIL